jgi:hypothetical protein
MRYTVTLTQVVERRITCEIESESKVKALARAKKFDWEDSDEETAPEDIIEVKDVKVIT